MTHRPPALKPPKPAPIMPSIIGRRGGAGMDMWELLKACVHGRYDQPFPGTVPLYAFSEWLTPAALAVAKYSYRAQRGRAAGR